MAVSKGSTEAPVGDFHMLDWDYKVGWAAVGEESSLNYMSESNFPAMTARIREGVQAEEVIKDLGAHETDSQVEEEEEGVS